MKKFSISLIFLLFSGCAVTLPPIQLYTLNFDNGSIVKTRPTAATLLVLQTQATPAFNTKKIAYVKGAYQIDYFTQNKWVAPPARQLTPLIVKALEASRHYHAVVSAPFAGITSLRLDTRLVRLSQVFTGNRSYVNMTLEAQIINADTERLIAEKRFDARVTALANNPYAGVVAANQATAIILKQLVNFCIQHSSYTHCH